MKSKSFLTLHRQQCKAQKDSEDIIKIVPVTPVVQPQCYEAKKILFVCKENKNSDII